MEIAQIQRAEILKFQPLSAREEHAALLFEQVEHVRQVVAAPVVDTGSLRREKVCLFHVLILRYWHLGGVFHCRHRDGFYGERSGNSHHTAHYLRAVVKGLLRRVALNACVDLLPLLAFQFPEAAQGCFRLLRPVFGWHGCGHFVYRPPVPCLLIDGFQQAFRFLLRFGFERVANLQ